MVEQNSICACATKYMTRMKKALRCPRSSSACRTSSWTGLLVLRRKPSTIRARSRWMGVCEKLSRIMYCVWVVRRLCHCGGLATLPVLLSCYSIYVQSQSPSDRAKWTRRRRLFSAHSHQTKRVLHTVCKIEYPSHHHADRVINRDIVRFSSMQPEFRFYTLVI